MTTSWTPQDGREPHTGELPVVTPPPAAEVHTRLHSRGQLLAERLPAWAGSIRFRLTAVYSTVVFGLAALVVAGIYLGLRYSLENQTVGTVYQLPQGQLVEIDTAPVHPEPGQRPGARDAAGVLVRAPCSRSSS